MRKNGFMAPLLLASVLATGFVVVWGLFGLWAVEVGRFRRCSRCLALRPLCWRPSFRTRRPHFPIGLAVRQITTAANVRRGRWRWRLWSARAD